MHFSVAAIRLIGYSDNTGSNELFKYSTTNNINIAFLQTYEVGVAI
jgi:hypothetical protein